MIFINQPIKCPSCGKKITDHYRNNNNKKLVFTCTCGEVVELAEQEYVREINKS